MNLGCHARSMSAQKKSYYMAGLSSLFMHYVRECHLQVAIPVQTIYCNIVLSIW